MGQSPPGPLAYASPRPNKRPRSSSSPCRCRRRRWWRLAAEGGGQVGGLLSSPLRAEKRRCGGPRRWRQTARSWRGGRTSSRGTVDPSCEGRRWPLATHGPSGPDLGQEGRCRSRSARTAESAAIEGWLRDGVAIVCVIPLRVC
jgi:hypothetical protein